MARCAMDYQDLDKETLQYVNRRRCPNTAMEGSPWCKDCAAKIKATQEKEGNPNVQLGR